VPGALQSLLMTDIVGSTRLWAEQETEMAVDLVAHDERVNAAVAAAGGRVFKHTGDGAMATFASASASAAAAAEIQRAIGTHAWMVRDGIRVRVALHSGSVHERGGDLFGPPVNRLARLLARCPPDAVLVSESTASLLADGIPSGLTLRELGRIELRDVGQSEAVHSLVGDHLAIVDPREVLGKSAVRGSLPPIDDDLVGRGGEIEAVLDAITAHPVVSIVGVGGMGKTRLALEAAAVAELPDGAWWCDLTAATSPEAVPVTVLAAIGARVSPGRNAAESVVDHLAAQDALVVLDNCEHVVDAARTLVEAIRVGCEKVRVLATSREALRLRGEHVIPLSSLPSEEAVGLFCTRAAEARADLLFDDASLAAVDEICARLDGIPLAIELAASRCRSMAPVEIASRLDDRFRLLRGGRGGVERHRTLQAAVEWSYSLLDDDERDLFDRMAVFAGGALIDAVSAVCGLDEYDALDVLDRLVSRSMVVAANTPLGTRYRQLETLRQYADDRLVEKGKALETRDRHLAWIRAFATYLRLATFTHAEADTFARYVVELDNVRAAVYYATTAGRDVEACEIIAGIGFHALCRPTYEVIDWLDPARIPTEQWTDSVASTTGVLAVLAFFTANTPRTTELLALVPEEFEHNMWILTAATYESLWITGDYGLAESRLAHVTPADEQEAVNLRMNQGQVFQTLFYSDRASDEEFVHQALAHMESLVADQRVGGAQLSLSGALAVYGFCLQGSGDYRREVAVLSESIELSESAGAWFTVDVARVGLVEAITQLAGSDPGQLRESALTVKATVEAALKRRNFMFVADYLCGAVERVLWVTGDRRTAAIIGKYVRSTYPMTFIPSTVDDVIFGTDELIEIEAEVLQLDIGTAAAMALAALDRVIAATA
jgi:predicted ATPase/class 3 adenylate cyclase